MTENEALEKHKEDCRRCRDKACAHGWDCLQKKDIEVYEEIQQYRAIGTIEEFKALKEADMRGANRAVDEFANYLHKIVRCNMKEFIEKLIGRLKEELPLYVGKAKKIVNELAEEYNDGWISVEDRLPEDCDNRFYMCIVENHEEDLPMFCQYDENYGFGFWKDIYDEHTLGFVDSEFRTSEELGYEKVVAWQNIPSYQPKGE